MCLSDDDIQTQITKGVERDAAIRNASQPADGVVQPARIVVADDSRVRVGDTCGPAVVYAAGHERVRILHFGGRAGVHSTGVGLPFGDELTQAVEGVLHLVDDVAPAGRIETGEKVRSPACVVGRLYPANGTIDASAKCG